MTTNKTNAKRSQTKKVTVPKMTMGAVMAHLKTARNANITQKRSKGYYTDNGAKVMAKAIARATNIDPMSSKKITTENSQIMAKRRREFAKANKASLVNVSDILAPNKGGEITHFRPENDVRSRLASIAKAMGLPADTFYAVRAEKYVEGETPKVYIVLK